MAKLGLPDLVRAAGTVPGHQKTVGSRMPPSQVVPLPSRSSPAEPPACLAELIGSGVLHPLHGRLEARRLEAELPHVGHQVPGAQLRGARPPAELLEMRRFTRRVLAAAEILAAVGLAYLAVDFVPDVFDRLVAGSVGIGSVGIGSVGIGSVGRRAFRKIRATTTSAIRTTFTGSRTFIQVGK